MQEAQTRLGFLIKNEKELQEKYPVLSQNSKCPLCDREKLGNDYFDRAWHLCIWHGCGADKLAELSR